MGWWWPLMMRSADYFGSAECRYKPADGLQAADRRGEVMLLMIIPLKLGRLAARQGLHS